MDSQNNGFVPPEENIITQTLRETLGEVEGGEAPIEGDGQEPTLEERFGIAEEPAAKEPAKEAAKEEKKDDGKNPPFVVLAEDGKTPVNPGKLMFEFKANGKIRQEPLEKVVQFAQLGVYNHEREQAFQQREEEVSQQVEEVYAELESRDQAIERLLTDPDYYAAVADRYYREKSPEREATRARAEAQTLREQMATRQEEVAGQQFFDSVVYPEINAIMQENPEIDDPEEVAARLAMMLEPLRVNGRIPVAKHRQVQALIASDLRDWARATNDRRKQKMSTIVTKAQTHEQRAKNALGAVASPTSIGVAPTIAPPRTGPVTIDDVDSEIMRDTIRAMRTG